MGGSFAGWGVARRRRVGGPRTLVSRPPIVSSRLTRAHGSEPVERCAAAAEPATGQTEGQNAPGERTGKSPSGAEPGDAQSARTLVKLPLPARSGSQSQLAPACAHSGSPALVKSPERQSGITSHPVHYSLRTSGWRGLLTPSTVPSCPPSPHPPHTSTTEPSHLCSASSHTRPAPLHATIRTRPPAPTQQHQGLVKPPPSTTAQIVTFVSFVAPAGRLFFSLLTSGSRPSPRCHHPIGRLPHRQRPRSTLTLFF